MQLFITYSSESERRYFLEMHKIPANNLIQTDASAWAESFANATGNKGMSVIITSPAATNHEALSKCLKRNGKYLFLSEGSNVVNLNVFNNSIFAKGASFISFDILEMFQEGHERIRE